MLRTLKIYIKILLFNKKLKIRVINSLKKTTESSIWIKLSWITKGAILSFALFPLYYAITLKVVDTYDALPYYLEYFSSIIYENNTDTHSNKGDSSIISTTTSVPTQETPTSVPPLISSDNIEDKSNSTQNKKWSFYLWEFAPSRYLLFSFCLTGLCYVICPKDLIVSHVELTQMLGFQFRDDIVLSDQFHWLLERCVKQYFTTVGMQLAPYIFWFLKTEVKSGNSIANEVGAAELLRLEEELKLQTEALLKQKELDSQNQFLSDLLDLVL